MYASRNYATVAILPMDGFPLSRNFHVRTHVNFTLVNKIGAMYERPRVNVKVDRVLPLTLTRDLPYIMPLFYLRALNLRAHARENYTAVEIHCKGSLGYGDPSGNGQR